MKSERLPTYLKATGCLFVLLCWRASGQTTEIQVDVAERLGPMAMGQMALGQGGLSGEPMWTDRIAEVRALHPKVIRLFVQEYFNLLPEPGRYHFAALDRSVNVIRQAGATPLMCLCFKPRLLFPEVSQDIVEPNDYSKWDDLVFALAKHYHDSGPAICYWEVGNEPDIGESGGCPYRFKPENYPRYYQHTAEAILGADPKARVGGPALASVHSPILPAWLGFCQSHGVPVDFVSWHIYSSQPRQIGGTIGYVKGLLKKYPGLHPETVLDEWNMDLGNPPRDPRVQPCYIVEVIRQMKEAGLDYSCYYHIRDWHVSFAEFAPFMSPEGAAFMTRWWNRRAQFDGLFDFQNQVRPAYLAFKLLARLAGQRLRLRSNGSDVHGLAAYDPQLRMVNALLWNFSGQPAQANLLFAHLPRDGRGRLLRLDAASPNSEETARLVPEETFTTAEGTFRCSTHFGPYSIKLYSFE